MSKAIFFLSILQIMAGTACLIAAAMGKGNIMLGTIGGMISLYWGAKDLRVIEKYDY